MSFLSSRGMRSRFERPVKSGKVEPTFVGSVSFIETFPEWARDAAFPRLMPR